MRWRPGAHWKFHQRKSHITRHNFLDLFKDSHKYQDSLIIMNHILIETQLLFRWCSPISHSLWSRPIGTSSEHEQWKYKCQACGEQNLWSTLSSAHSHTRAHLGRLQEVDVAGRLVVSVSKKKTWHGTHPPVRTCERSFSTLSEKPFWKSVILALI